MAKVVKVETWVQEPMVGVKATLDDGSEVITYMNPSDLEDNATPDVFIYQGTGDPNLDRPVCYIDLVDTRGE